MHAANYYPLLAWAINAQAIRYAVLTGLVLLTGGVLVLARTRWGQSNSLRKCIVLSLLVHLLIGIYAATVEIVTAGPRGGNATSISFVDEAGDAAESRGPSAADDSEEAPPAAESADSALTSPVVEGGAPRSSGATPSAIADSAVRPDAAVAAAAVTNSDATSNDRPAESASANRPTNDDIPAPEIETTTSINAASDAAATAGNSTPAASNTPAAARHDTPPRPEAETTAGAAAGRLGPIDPLPNSDPAPLGQHPLPNEYALRMAQDHVRVAEDHGGSEETERTVGMALKFLVANQSPDGRWNARSMGGGRQATQDRNRLGAGGQADTGITGLCLLSLLAAGHTHLAGEHREAVRSGLEFLLNAQAADGNLSGNATLYERMYCHGMAAFALSEAYAMSGDERLQTAVRATIHYTLASQHPVTGGWRYQPGDPGDMSQFGWQAMALKSAQLGGIKIPDETRARMHQFLQSVSSGRQGGLAGYRPGHPASRAMTAEALVCHQFLGMAETHPAAQEAGDLLMQELPGQGPANVYYWYYGTLGMYQLQGNYWKRWNAALQAELLSTQRQDGKLAGSWNPDTVWGGYGGRAYSTAISTLCLEVYYRFLPVYAAHGNPQPAAEIR